jgi:hypothetical protein
LSVTAVSSLDVGIALLAFESLNLGVEFFNLVGFRSKLQLQRFNSSGRIYVVVISRQLTTGYTSALSNVCVSALCLVLVAGSPWGNVVSPC